MCSPYSRDPFFLFLSSLLGVNLTNVDPMLSPAPYISVSRGSPCSATRATCRIARGSSSLAQPWSTTQIFLDTRWAQGDWDGPSSTHSIHSPLLTVPKAINPEEFVDLDKPHVSFPTFASSPSLLPCRSAVVAMLVSWDFVCNDGTRSLTVVACSDGPDFDAFLVFEGFRAPLTV